MIETLSKPSSTIQSSTYDSANQELAISFHGGSTYKYRNVPQAVWLGMQNSSSVGEYHGRQIKGRYAYERME